MALADEIAVKLGLNASQFKAALKEAGAEIDALKKKADPTLWDKIFAGAENKLAHIKGLTGALIVASGFSAEKIAEKLANLWFGISEEEKKAYEGLGELSTRAADANIEAMRAGLSEEKKYLLAVREREGILLRISQENGKTAVSQVRIKEQEIKLAENSRIIEAHKLEILREQTAALKEQVGLNEETIKGERDGLSIYQKRRLLEADIQALKKFDSLQSGNELQHELDLIMLKSRETQLVQVNAEITKKKTADEKEQYEFSVLQFKSKTGLTDAEKRRYEILKITTKELRVQSEIDDLLAKNHYEKLTPADNRRLLSLQTQLRVLEKQASVINSVASETERVAKIEKDITEEKERQIELTTKNNKLYSDFVSNLLGLGIGKNFKDATSEALDEIVRRAERGLSKIRQDPGFSPTAFNRNQADVFNEAQLQNELAGAQREIAFRRDFKQTVGVMGAEEARANFAGDPLQFDRVLSQFTEKQDKSTGILQSLDDRLATAGFGRR